MKNTKKVGTIILVATLAVLTFVGCSDSTNKASKPGEESSKQETSVVSEVEESSLEESSEEIESKESSAVQSSSEKLESEDESSEVVSESESSVEPSSEPEAESSAEESSEDTKLKLTDAIRFGRSKNEATIYNTPNNIVTNIAEGNYIAILSFNDDNTYSIIEYGMVFTISQDDVELFPEDYVPDTSEIGWKALVYPIY